MRGMDLYTGAAARRRAGLDEVLRLSAPSKVLLDAGFVEARDVTDPDTGAVVRTAPAADAPSIACAPLVLSPDRLAAFMAVSRAVETPGRGQRAGPYGFVASASALVLDGLLHARALCPGAARFCEWGSGDGVATSFAAMLGFEASGIERDPALVGVARELAGRFAPAARFVEGSYVPRGGEAITEELPRSRWMATASDDAYDRLGLAASDFDVVFAYPWPDERSVVDDLFITYAKPGALLVTYCAWDGVVISRRRRDERLDPPGLYSA